MAFSLPLLSFSHKYRLSALELVTSEWSVTLWNVSHSRRSTIVEQPRVACLFLGPRTNRLAPLCFSTSMGNTRQHCLQHRVSAIQLGTQSSWPSNSIRLVWKLLDNWHLLHSTHTYICTHTHWHTNDIFISPCRFPCLVQLTGLGLCVAPHTVSQDSASVWG